MRVLLDECVDERVRTLFGDHDVVTARHAGFTGLKNGALLAAAEAAGYEALVTVDQNLPEQQNLFGRRIGIVVLCARTNRRADLLPLVPAAIDALARVRAGEVIRVVR